jgi:stage IV sporulation protein FB
MNFLKCKPKEVYIGIFDIVIVDLNYYKRSFLYDEIILLSGPFFNIFFASLALLINSLSSFKYQWLDDLFFTNMTLGIFNLMPIIPLDGGQVLYSFLLSKTEEKKAKTISLTISFSILFPSAVIGFLILLNKKNDFSLLFTSFYLIIMLLTKKNTII